MNTDQMSNADLLGAVVGPRRASAMLALYTVTAIGTMPPEVLAETAKVPYSTAVRAKAAVGLSKAIARDIADTQPVLDHPEALWNLLGPFAMTASVETLRVVTLNTRARLIKIHVIAEGMLDHLLVHAREVFRPAILDNAHSIIVSHNHPSGDPMPSEADIRVTRELIRSGKLLKIDVLDHIVVGKPSTTRPKAYCSLRELGYFAAA